VQALDAMHHFTWDMGSHSWSPSGSDLIPFGCQHSITALTPVALLGEIQECCATEGQQASKHTSGKQQGTNIADGVQCEDVCASSRPVPVKAHVRLTLEVFTKPGQVLVGWVGSEQEQQVNAQSKQKIDTVHLLARSEGRHVPVTITGCQPSVATQSSTGYPQQKQVCVCVCIKYYTFVCTSLNTCVWL